MPETKTCTRCNGSGRITVLVSQHDDKTEVVDCTACLGKGVIHHMTEQDESDYRDSMDDW